MEGIQKSLDMVELMKSLDISGEKTGAGNQHLARCPFHHQEASCLFDTDKKEYFCICEGLKGD